MKINTSNAFSSVRSRMSSFSQNVRAKVSTRMSDVSERIRTTMSEIDDRRFMRAQAKREKEAAKYVTFRNWGTYDTPVANELYRMREPIASFAKAHNITVDVYNPKALVNEKPLEEGATGSIAVLVNNPKTGKMKTEFFDGNPSAEYPKERAQKFMINVSGEQDLQTEGVGIFSVNDSPLTHIFRTLESMVDSVK